MGVLRGLLLVSFLLVLDASTVEKKSRLVILMIDGMRWDYIDRDPTLKGFPRIFKNGVKVPYVTPVFPSVSFPNWYTIATGLYGESHGMIANSVYDPVRRQTLTLPPAHSGDEEHWWNKTEPIWVNAEKNDIRTAMHWWDGCRVSIRGFKPKICDLYRPFRPWPNVLNDTRKAMINLLEWFEKGDKNRLGMVYFEGPDSWGHLFGPDSAELRESVRDIDSILNDFQDSLEKSNLKNEVNLMVVSDHGMTESSLNIPINLNFLNISESIEKAMGGGPFISILPEPGKEKELYEILKANPMPGLHVYKRENIPEIYHLNNSYLTMPILLVADLGFSINSLKSRSKREAKHGSGSHGYDPYVENSPMRTIMYARGPVFKKGFIGVPLEQTDHYNVFCKILDIEAHSNNGSWDRVRGLLQDSPQLQDPPLLHRSHSDALTPGTVTSLLFIMLNYL